VRTGELAGFSTRVGAALGLGAVGDGCTRVGGELEVVVGACTRAGGAVSFVGGELELGDAAGVNADGYCAGLAGGRVGDVAGVNGTELAAGGAELVAGGCGDAACVDADNIGGELVETIGLAAGASGAACASLPSSQRATTRLPTT
jgi:hypothetical protein